MSDTQALETVIKEKSALMEMVSSMDENLQKYKELGTPEEIEEALDKASEIVNIIKESGVSLENLQGTEAYDELGTPEEIEEALDKSMELFSQYQELGTPSEIEESIRVTSEIMAKYSELGSPEEIEEAFNVVERTFSQYKELGSPSEIEEAFDSAENYINQYKELGSPSEIEDAIDRASDILESYRDLGNPSEIGDALNILEDRIIDDKSTKLATKYNVDRSVVSNMYKKVNSFQILEELLAGTTTGKVPSSTGKKKSSGANFNESVVRRLSRSIM